MKNEVEQREQYWLKPEQVTQMRLAAHEASPDYLQSRDKLLLRALYQWGLRVSEAVALDTEMFDLADRALRLPSHIQKDYPTKGSPPPATIDLSPEDVESVNDYLNSRWKDTDALFPARSSPRMSERAAQNVVKKLSVEADIRPHHHGGRGEAEDVSPHSLRHSVAYRMIERENESLDAVQRRLRHATILTTQREYSHFDRV